MVKKLQELVEAHFPASLDECLVRGITEGIALADQLRVSEPILFGPVGSDLSGHLRRAGIMSRIQTLCDRYELPFEATVEHMPIGNWHHLVLKATDSLVSQGSDTVISHLCRTESALAFPKDTPNRQDERLTNQPDLFDDNVVDFNTVIKSVQEKCVWLTYGCTSDGELTHVCWAMPSPPIGPKNWLAHVNVLQRSKYSGQSRKPKSVDPSDVLKFKHDILRNLKNKIEED